MIGDLYDRLLNRGKKVRCSRCNRPFDEDDPELEPGKYGGVLCKSCSTPTMRIFIPWWVEDAAKKVKFP